jgi:hypothetical protein
MSLLIISWFSYLLVFGLLAALAYRDLKDYILPNHLNAALALAFLSFHIATEWQIMTPVEAISGGLTGGGFLWVVFCIKRKIFFKCLFIPFAFFCFYSFLEYFLIRFCTAEVCLIFFRPFPLFYGKSLSLRGK